MLEEKTSSILYLDSAAYPILVCLLGNILVLQAGQSLAFRRAGKAKGLLGYLGLHYRHRVTRAVLLQRFWPNVDETLASQSLHTLIYSLHKLMGDALGGSAPVIYDEGGYRLNREAGVSADLEHFDSLIMRGDHLARSGDLPGASALYSHAAGLYRGNLCTDLGADVDVLLEREQLRARCLTLLARLADYHYSGGNYGECLAYAWRLLAFDPCREDAHRLVMRCHVHLGERSEGLHHYRTCVNILRVEFDAAPESATTALFDQIRHNPATV